MKKPCPALDVEIPKKWIEPEYAMLKPGFVQEGKFCLSEEDTKKVISNQATCDLYRINLVDLILSIKGEKLEDE